jgi:hypothetical protein
MAKRKKRYRGHYCWCCDRIRPNEKFSGKGHAQHLCKACARLGAEELAYRQALRNLERCMDMSTTIPRKHRTSFNRFLTHKDPRIRAVAREMEERDVHARAKWREMRRQELELEDLTLETWAYAEASAAPEVGDATDCEDFDDDELLF